MLLGGDRPHKLGTIVSARKRQPHRGTPARIHKRHQRAIFKRELEFGEARRPGLVTLDAHILGCAHAFDTEVSCHAKVHEQIWAITAEGKPEILAFAADALYGPTLQRGDNVCGRVALKHLCTNRQRAIAGKERDAASRAVCRSAASIQNAISGRVNHSTKRSSAVTD